jgi:hypothetical protein
MKTLAEVQQVLDEQLEKLHKGEIDARTARAICMRANKLMRAARLQLKGGKLTPELARFFEGHAAFHQRDHKAS